MSETKHTPGPWVLTRDNLGCKNIYQRSDPQNGGIFAVAEIGYTYGRADEDEDGANARLIAAAPDLLNALTALANVAEARGIPVDAARAAIAKATA